MRHASRNVQLWLVLWSSINRARLITSIGLSDNVGIKVEKGATMWNIRAVGSRGTDLGTERLFHMQDPDPWLTWKFLWSAVWLGLTSKAGLMCWNGSFVFPLSDHICSQISHMEGHKPYFPPHVMPCFIFTNQSKMYRGKAYVRNCNDMFESQR